MCWEYEGSTEKAKGETQGWAWKEQEEDRDRIISPAKERGGGQGIEVRQRYNEGQDHGKQDWQGARVKNMEGGLEEGGKLGGQVMMMRLQGRRSHLCSLGKGEG